MRINIWEDEYVEWVFQVVPKKRGLVAVPGIGIYEINDNTYKKWMKVFKDFDDIQTEIKEIMKEQDKKKKKSINPNPGSILRFK